MAASCQHAAVAGLIDPKKIVRSRPCWSRTETAACDGLFLKNRSISAAAVAKSPARVATIARNTRASG